MRVNNFFEFLVAVVAVAIAAGLGYFLWDLLANNKPQPPVSCTQEAKVCPDGSTVGRTGSNCEFAACPTITTNPDWKTFSDSAAGISFQYPESLNTTYITTVDWPPAATTTAAAFACTQAGSEIAPAGLTEQKIINGHTYCVTRESEGAAGSIYVQYGYAFPKNNQTTTLTFALRFPQCANYPDPQKTACTNEQTAFNIDNVVDGIATSLSITPPAN